MFMEEFCGMEDWGLQAVVRGFSGDFTNIINTGVDDQNSFFGIDQKFDHGFIFDFPEIFNFSGDELEELYKPFYPAVTSSVPAETVVEFKEETPANVVQEKQTDYNPSETSDSTSMAAAYTPKYKRRKNQHKRVVVQVSAEGLTSDIWAWRKYGQKPIKGSPHPRSYYRCSSSKGCLARKQVEQSYTDPGMFIITYTAEHSHSKPTRRNSLAGTIRQKFPASKSSTYRTNIKQERAVDSISGSRISAPETVLPSPVDEDFFQVQSNQDGKEGEELIFGDDFFSGLEEFDGYNLEILPISCHSSAQQFPLSSC
ncbi:unnamed protein product [Fraxinus pennsylvanica]|uniref:WRKY domain-containing protein n=1 Tax=Fraxinus pennsylvanica TaxID=56036 RepID=A0AAD1YQG0_9LAMI|nr:unnamed protein product [Fraxinus pennsylvanica]